MDYTFHHNYFEIDPQSWNDLLRDSVLDSPFLRHEYQRVWWEHRGGGEWPQARPLLVSAHEAGRLIGIAPLFLAEHDNQRALMLNGSIEISDYLDLIVRPADHEMFVSGLLDVLAARPVDDWCVLDWYNLPDSSPTLAVLKEEAARRGWLHHEEIYRPTPRIQLHDNFDEYLSRLEKKQRHEIRRKIRRAEESGRGVRWFVSDMADPDTEIDSFLSLMEDDPNKAKFLREPMRTQMREIMRAAHEGGWLWLAFLEVEGRRGAAALNFDYGNKLWGYNAGVNRAYMDLSPGWVLLGYILRWGCESRRTEFDFMRGDEEYKYRFGGVNQYVMRVRSTRQ